MRTIITKICSRCGKEKRNTEFYFSAETGKKYSHKKCKQCCKEKAQERYRLLTDEEKKSKHNTPERRKYYIKYAHLHPEKYMMASIRGRAKDRGIECTIQESDIVIPETCPYLGIKLLAQTSQGNGKGKTLPNSASVDRIDPTKGYVQGNIQVISHLANRMKSNATLDQLLEFSKNVIRIYGER